MSLRFCSLGSGSSGNCVFVASPKASLMIDAGLSVKRVAAAMSLLNHSPSEVDGILLTHTHSDHIGQLEAFVKRFGIKVYCSQHIADEVLRKAPSLRQNTLCVFDSSDFWVEDITISPFALSHDVPCVGYTLVCQGKQLSIATDVGKLGDRAMSAMSDSDLVMIEANHDVDTLLANPHYPSHLKRRILSDKGHLSNTDSASAISQLVGRGVKQIILAHLSHENNCPDLAFSTVSDTLSLQGLMIGTHYEMEIARQDRMTSLYEVV